MFLNMIPGVGHAKGVFHYLAGEIDEGHEAMLEATRTSAALIGGAAGACGGPAGAALGGAAGSAIVDTAASILKSEPQGVVQNLRNIAKDIKKGKVPLLSTLETGVTFGTDLLTGLGAGAILSSATKSAGKSFGKTLFKSAVKSLGKSVTKQEAKFMMMSAATTGVLLASSGGGGGGGGGTTFSGYTPNSCNSRKSTKQSGDSGTRTDSNQNNNSNNTKKSGSETTGSDAPGSQPPRRNKNNSKKECESTELQLVLQEFLEIFHVESLDSICIEGQYIFRGLSLSRRMHLARRLLKVKRINYNVNHVVKIILKIFSQICTGRGEVNFGNFLSLLEYVSASVGEEQARLNDLYNANARHLRSIVNIRTFSQLTIGERLRQLAEIVTSNILSSRGADVLSSATSHRVVSRFRSIRAQVEQFNINPDFRDVYAAVYHFYKHCYLEDQNRELSVAEYYEIISDAFKEILSTERYARLQRGEIQLLQRDLFLPRWGKVRIVLKNQGGKLIISSVYIPY